MKHNHFILLFRNEKIINKKYSQCNKLYIGIKLGMMEAVFELNKSANKSNGRSNGSGYVVIAWQGDFYMTWIRVFFIIALLLC
jgi:hypothetical protein